jgi:hypothetical protein
MGVGGEAGGFTQAKLSRVKGLRSRDQTQSYTIKPQFYN